MPKNKLTKSEIRNLKSQIDSALARDGRKLAWLADQLHLHRASLYRKLRGQLPWQPSELAAIAVILNITPTG